MDTLNCITVHAPLDRLFALAAAVEDWPFLLSHYRYVRIRSQLSDGRVVEMATRHLALPERWIAIQRLYPAENRITYKHIGGVTRGMDVEWRLRQEGDHVSVTISHQFAPPWPVVEPWASRYIVGALFVSPIADRTLRGLQRHAEWAST